MGSLVEERVDWGCWRKLRPRGRWQDPWLKKGVVAEAAEKDGGSPGPLRWALALLAGTSRG